MCHVINLVCKAILYGVDIDCVEEPALNSLSQFEDVLRGKDELAKLQAWRKKGPIGKLHNVIIHVCRSTARRQFFRSKQKEAYPETERLYQLVVNGGIRWNSTCDMLERAFKLKDAIELYQQYYKADIDEPLEDDYLTTDDWLELSEVLQLLQPLKQVSLTLQSDGKDCNHGSLWESLTAIDFLMSRLEELKEHHTFLPASHFKASVNLGWKKLDKYYRLSDNSPAYRAAIVVHPAKKMRWFEAKWNKHHPEWIAAARDDITALYNEYKTRHADEAITSTVPPMELSEFDKYNLLEDDFNYDDDLERFLREERTPSNTNPLQWWIQNHHRYPILRHMAFDLLATPASSTADERTFSKAGHTINNERFNTKDDLAEANQCMRSWIEEGVIYHLSKKNKRNTSGSSSE